jgi:uncharacterized membrane protein
MNYFQEFLLTFSTKKSFFSSKKLERFVVFSVFLLLTVVFLLIRIKTLTSIEFIEVVGLWLVYGGYNTLQTIREKKLEKEELIES